MRGMERLYEASATISSEGRFSEREMMDRADEILEAVQRDATAIALGPVVSVDFTESEIEVTFSVLASSPEDLHTVVVRVEKIMSDNANSFDYEGSSTRRLPDEELAAV